MTKEEARKVISDATGVDFAYLQRTAVLPTGTPDGVRLRTAARMLNITLLWRYEKK